MTICNTRPMFSLVGGGAVSRRPSSFCGRKTIDERAVYSVLQYGAVVPPLAPWKEIERIDARTGVEDECMTINSSPAFENGPADLQAQVCAVENVIDDILQEALKGVSEPVLLFSGGVDSSFLASRLRHLGFVDTILINFAFSDDDAEAELASSMAKALSLRYERVYPSEMRMKCLDKPGQVYPQPFGDHSVVPTADLANSVSAFLGSKNSVIIDGTGADGAFGIDRKFSVWKKLALLRGIGFPSNFYKYLWHENGALERVVRLARRMRQKGVTGGLIAQNPLCGILYNVGAEREVDHLLRDWVEGCGYRFDTRESTILADMALTCAGIFAQKALPIFEEKKHTVLFPFLDPRVVSLAVNFPEKGREAKSQLKASLSGVVPERMVFRPKSGFIAPQDSVFHTETFLACLHDATEDQAPLSPYLVRRRVREAASLLLRGRTLPPQTLNCLWAIAFTDRWYRTSQYSFGLQDR